MIIVILNYKKIYYAILMLAFLTSNNFTINQVYAVEESWCLIALRRCVAECKRTFGESNPFTWSCITGCNIAYLNCIYDIF